MDLISGLVIRDSNRGRRVFPFWFDRFGGEGTNLEFEEDFNSRLAGQGQYP